MGELSKVFSTILFMLLIPLTLAAEIEPKTLNVQEFDYIKCKNDTQILTNIYFNETSSKRFFVLSNNEFSKNGYSQDLDYNSRVNSHFTGDIRYILRKEGVQYIFISDGYWWILSANYNITGESYPDVAATISSTKNNMIEIKRIFSWIRERTLSDIESYHDFECHLSSTFSEDEVMLSLFNFYNYEGAINCITDTTSYFADCKNSEFYRNVSSIVWGKKNYEEKVQYIMDNNLIFLDRTDLSFGQNEGYNSYGNEIVLSQDEFSTGFNSGQGSFVYQYGYLRQIEEIPQLVTQLDSLNNELKEKIKQVDLKVDEINEILSSDSQITKKIEDVRKITLPPSDEIEHYQSKIEYYSKLSNIKNSLNKETHTAFYEDYYQNVLNFYQANLQNSLENLKSSIELYRQRKDNLNSYTSQSISNLVSEQSRLENAASTNINVTITLIILFVTVMLYFFDKIIETYGYQSAILSLAIVGLSYFAWLPFLPEKWVNLCFTIILELALIWIMLPIIFVNYSLLKQIKHDRINLYPKAIFYSVKLDLIFDIYCKTHSNLNLRFHSIFKDKIHREANILISDANEIIQKLTLNSKLTSKEKHKLISGFEMIKIKSGLYRNYLTYALSSDMIPRKESDSFQTYITDLNQTLETSLSQLMYKRTIPNHISEKNSVL